MNISTQHKENGFTLVELLVVIAIIGLLSSIALVSLSSARMKARDAQRLSDLHQLSIALALYYDSARHYPTGGWYADCWTQGNWIPDNGNYNWSDGYISTQPRDPADACLWPFGGQGAINDANPTATYAYWSDTGQRYALVARLEDSRNRNTVQNSGTRWFDGNSLYSYHQWVSRATVVFSK